MWMLAFPLKCFTSFDGNSLEIKYSTAGKLKQPKFAAIIRLMPFFNVNFSTEKHTQNDCSAAMKTPAFPKNLFPMLFEFDWIFFCSHLSRKTLKRKFHFFSISSLMKVYRRNCSLHSERHGKFFRCFEYTFFFFSLNNINFSLTSTGASTNIHKIQLFSDLCNCQVITL